MVKSPAYRKLLLVAASVTLLFFAAKLYLAQDQFLSPYFRYHGIHSDHRKAVLAPVTDGAILSAANITQYLDAILETKPSTLPTVQCPAINTARYGLLKGMAARGPDVRYFFALNLRQNLELLPRLIGSIVESIRFLGPEYCVLSIVEGNSPDGTADILKSLRPALENMGATYYFDSVSLDPSKDDRIGRLAELRNLALAPLLKLGGKASKDTTVIFINDVAACAEDILELVHQKRAIGADMTCAMDWMYDPNGSLFYDVWISRTIDGDSFFDFPPDGSWSLAADIFWNSEKTKSRFIEKRPFQVFACWNGATAFTAQPILEKTVRFRAPAGDLGECMQGEPQLFCKDLWFHGYRKIAVVPSVNFEYTVEKGNLVKQEKGYTSDTVSRQDPAGDEISWQLEPPSKVKCYHGFHNPVWQAWNETLK